MKLQLLFVGGYMKNGFRTVAVKMAAYILQDQTTFQMRSELQSDQKF